MKGSGMVIFLTIVGVLLVLGAFIAFKVAPAAEAARADAWALQDQKIRSLAQVEGFNPAIAYHGHPGANGLAIDPESDQFAVAIPGAPVRVYGFDQLVAAEVVRDGQTITTTKGKVDTRGAALGTLLAGPVGGLLVGAKTSSTSESRTITTTLSLKLFVNDLHTPTIYISFLGSGLGWQEGGIHFAKAVEELDAWYGRFRTIIAGFERQGHGEPASFSFAKTEPLPVQQQKGFFARTFGP
jgi:hypothetical protein